VNAADLEGLIPELFAPWVRQLDMSVVELGDREARFEIGENADLVRTGGPGGGVICGQALSAAADTLSVLTLAYVNGEFRPCTTSDLQIRFMRPVPLGRIDVRVSALSNGKRMAVTQVECRAAGDTRLCAAGSTTFVYLSR